MEIALFLYIAYKRILPGCYLRDINEITGHLK